MEEVRNWLRGLGLEQYAPKFEEEGWDTPNVLCHMKPEEIERCIDKPGHRRKFEVGLKENPPTDQIPDSSVYGADENKDFLHTPIEPPGIAEVFLSRNSSRDKHYKATVTTKHAKVQQLKRTDDVDDVTEQTEIHDTNGDTQTVSERKFPHGITETSPGDSISEIDFARAKVETVGTGETFLVSGARNKMIKRHFDTAPLNNIQGCEMVDSISSRSMAVLGNEPHTTKRVKLTDDGFSDSSSDEDSNALSTVTTENRIEGRYFMLGQTTRTNIERATIVKDSTNVTIAKKAEVYHVHQNDDKRQTTDNFKDQTANVVRSFKRKDHLYVETKAFRELTEIVDDRHWTLIAGNPGDGKTAMAAHSMLLHKEKGFESVIITNPQDWKALVKGSCEGCQEQKQFVMIDDMFGSMSVDNRRVDEWVPFIDFMQRVVKERNGNLIVVCTSRKYVFNDIKSKVEKFTCFQDTSVVDMTLQKYALTVEEKLSIWKNYTKEYNVRSFEPSCIYETVSSPHGFPHCVELYCSNQFLRNKGVKFFENPMKFVCREIKNFMENDKIKYCLLLLILFKNNNLTEDVLQKVVFSDPPKDVLRLFKAAGLSAEHAQPELKKALESLKNTYVSELTVGVYCFSHESIRENVAYLYIKDNPLYAIEDIDFGYLVDHTRCHGYKACGEDNIFVLPSFCTAALAERALKEITNGNIVTVCEHQAWDDFMFVEKWMECVLVCPNGDKAKAETYASSIKTIFSIQNTCRSNFQIIKLNLLETLIYCGRENAILQICKNVNLIKQLKVNGLQDLMSYVLVCACFYLPSENVVATLIQAGADVNVAQASSQLSRFEHPAAWKVICFSGLFNPLFLAAVLEDETLIKLLLGHGGSVYLGGKPLVVLIALERKLPNIFKELLYSIEAGAEWKKCFQRTSPDDTYLSMDEDFKDVFVWDYMFFRFVPSLGFECFLSTIHLANDLNSLLLLIERGVNVNQDVILADGRRMTHCIYRMLNGVHNRILYTLCTAGMKITGLWNGKTSLHYFIQNVDLWPIQNSFLIGSFVSELHAKDVARNCQFIRDVISTYSAMRSIDEIDVQGGSPLHYLFWLWHCFDLMSGDRLAFFRTALEAFLAFGANVNLQDENGTTPVMLCLRNCLDVQSITKCLDERTPKMVDKRGRGYFHYLAESDLPTVMSYKICTTLLESDENINLKDNYGNLPVFYCRSSTFPAFLDAKACLDSVNKAGQTILFYNILRCNVDLIESIALQTKGLSHTDAAGRTLMHCLMKTRTHTLSNIYKILELLLQMNLDLNTPDNNGITPLMLAVENGEFYQFIEYLLEQTPDLTRTDIGNLSVLHHCIGGELHDIIKIEIIGKLVAKSKDLLHVGVNLLQYASGKTTCGAAIILELLNYCKTISYNSMEIVQGILKSKRRFAEKAACLYSLFRNKKIGTHEILTNSQATIDMKVHLAVYFLQRRAWGIQELSLLWKDAWQVIPELDDVSALGLLQEIYKYKNLHTTLTDFRLYKILCAKSLFKSLRFILSVDNEIDRQDQDGNTKFQTTVENIKEDQEAAAILTLLIQKLDVNERNKEMLKLIHVVCKQSPIKPQTTYKIISEMTEIDQIDFYGMTALQYLCSNENAGAEDSTQNHDHLLYLALCLLDKGADVDHQNYKGETSIMLAIRQYVINEDLLTLIIQNSKNVNIADLSGNTALHHILRSTANDRVKSLLIHLLLNKGGDVRLQNENGQSCLLIMQHLVATRSVGLDVFASFMPYGFIGDMKDVLDIIFRHFRYVRGESSACLQIIKDLIIQREIDVNSRSETDANTMLMVASECVLPGTVKMLLSLKADANVLDMVGYTCFIRLLASRKLAYLSLICACYTGGNMHREVFMQMTSYLFNSRERLAFTKVIETAEYIFTVCNEYGYEIISIIKNAALDLLKALLSNGADPNIRDVTGKTALHHFVQSPVTDVFVCPALKLLLEHGADANARDNEGMTPLMACAQFLGRKSNRMTILMAAGARIRDIDNFGCDVVEYGKMAYAGIYKVNNI